jgi:hypothetical protein
VLVISSESEEVYRVPRSQVRELRVLRGKERHPWRGLAIGLGAGAASGFLLGIATADGGTEWFSPAEVGLLGGIALGAIGGATGLLLGTFIKTDQWESVRHPSLQLSPDGRFGLRISIPLRRWSQTRH